MSGEIVIGPLGRMAMRYRGRISDTVQARGNGSFYQDPADVANLHADMNAVRAAQREWDSSIERAVDKAVRRDYDRMVRHER